MFYFGERVPAGAKDQVPHCSSEEKRSSKTTRLVSKMLKQEQRCPSYLWGASYPMVLKLGERNPPRTEGLGPWHWAARRDALRQHRSKPQSITSRSRGCARAVTTQRNCSQIPPWSYQRTQSLFLAASCGQFLLALGLLWT